MSTDYRLKLFAVAGTAILLNTGALAQNLLLQLPTADQPVAPQYPASVLNNGQPQGDIRTITGFERTFGYGSSSTNTRRADTNINQNTPGNNAVFTEVNTNGHAIYIELFSPFVGASNVRGSSFPPATNLADGGSNSVTALTGTPAGCRLFTGPGTAPAGQGFCTQQPQVLEFQTVYGRYRPGDIVVQWSGINDWNVSNITTTATRDAIINQNVTFQTEMVRQNIGLGARNYVFVGLADLGTFRNFTQPSRNNDPNLLSTGSLATNAGMLSNLIALHQQTGANIHYVDSALLVNQIRANPGLYGFTPAGVAPNNDCIAAFGGATQCASQPFNVQNQFMSLDGLHWTYRFHQLLGAVIANQLLAPYTLAAQADAVDATATVLSNSLMRRFSDYRNSIQLSSLVSADMPVKAAAPSRPGVVAYGPLALFIEGIYANGSRPDRLGAVGFDYNVGGVTVGGEYRISPNLLVGAVFNYSDTTANLNHGWGRVTSDSYQFAGYASWSDPNFFFDAALSGGLHDLRVTRPGVVSNLSASPDAGSFVTQAKTGYLFDVAAVPLGLGNAAALRAGPIAGVTYSRVRVNDYTESGDPLLTQAVQQQDREGVTARAGLEVRYPWMLGAVRVSPWIDVTVEHDFRGGARTLTTAQTGALALTILTPVTAQNETYGRFAGGVSAQVWNNVSLNVNGEFTFGRSDQNDYAVTGGLKVVW